MGVLPLHTGCNEHRSEKDGATDVGDDDAAKDRGYARLRHFYAARNAHCLETRLTPCALIRGVIVSAHENKYDSCTNYSDTLSRKLRAF